MMDHSVNRFELLLQEEEMLTQEVTAFDKKLESWSAVSSTKPVVVTMCMSGALAGRQHKPETDTTPPPVLAFEVSILQCLLLYLKNLTMAMYNCIVLWNVHDYHYYTFACSASSNRLGAIKEDGTTMIIRHS